MPSSITLTVADLPTSTSFFLSALQPLNYVYRGRVGNTIGFGLPDTAPDFWITQEEPGVPAGAAHVAFPAASQKKVQEFFVAALKAGGKCHGEPLLRDPVSGYFSAAVIDFDGNSIEAVHRNDLVLDSSDESRPGSIASVNSNKSKSSQAAPTSSPRSKAPSTASRSPTQASKTPSAVPSQSPSQASRSSTQVSKAPSAVPSQSPTQAFRAPTQVSKAPSASPSVRTQQPQAISLATAPNGEMVSNIVTEARGYINVARQLVNEARPALDSSNSAPNIHEHKSNPQSHQPSDTIVGTLLGVAAGAALHYAYTKATKDDSSKEPRRSVIARTRTDPNLESYSYHQEYAHQSPYTIESPPSEYSQSRSQRYITMNDAERASDYASTIRPGRRNSLSSSAAPPSASRASIKMLEAPPSSFRTPSYTSKASSRRSSTSRRHHSDEDLRSKAKSSASSRRSSGIKSHHVSRAPSPNGSERTAVPIAPRKSSGGSGGSRSAPSRSHSSKDLPNHPAPPSRASTWTGSDASKSTAFYSANTKPIPVTKSTLAKLQERERAGGRNEITKSVVGKVQDVSKLNLPREEVAPSDSVSQISSVAGSRKTSKSRR